MKEGDILALLSYGERNTLECKRAERGVPTSLWSTYSAFANTDGGVILLGVEERQQEKELTKRYEISGVDNADKMIKDLWNTINSVEKVNINLLQNGDIDIVTIDGKDVVVMNVPRAEYTQRPIYINNNILRGTYKRNHEGDYHCSEQMVRMMVRDAYEDGNDRLFLENYTMDDIDIPTLEGYRMMFRINNPDHIWNDLGQRTFSRS